MKIQFLKGPRTSAVQLLEGCPGVKAVPRFSVFPGTLGVKSLADEEGWHFCSEYPWDHVHSLPRVGRDQHPGKGISQGCVLHPRSSPSPACTDPRPRSARGLWTSHFIPLTQLLICQPGTMIASFVKYCKGPAGGKCFEERCFSSSFQGTEQQQSHCPRLCFSFLSPRESRKWWWYCGWGKREIMVVLWFET